jgi:hypothetical protein
MVTKKFLVEGEATISVRKVVEISYDEKDEDFVDEDGNVDEDALKSAAIDMAYSEFGGLTGYVGNGGYDKLIGVHATGESIEADCEVEFKTAEEQQ